MGDLPGEQQAGGVAAAGDPEPPPGLVQMSVDGVLGDPQAARDLLGVEVFGDQPETLPLTRCQPLYRHRVVTLPHKRRGKCPARVSSIPIELSRGARLTHWPPRACGIMIARATGATGKALS